MKTKVSVFLDHIVVALLAPVNEGCCQYFDLASGGIVVLPLQGTAQEQTSLLGEDAWAAVKKEPERFILLQPLGEQQVTPWYWEFTNTCSAGMQRQELLQLLDGEGFLARFYDALYCDDGLRGQWRQFEAEKVREYFLKLLPSCVSVEFCSCVSSKESLAIAAH